MEKIVYITAFLLSTANYVVNISIPLYLIKKFSAPPLILGISGFMGNFSYTFSTYIFYKLGKNFNFPWFIISCVLIGCVYLFLPILPSYFLIFIFLFFNGFFFSRFWPSIQHFFRGNIGNIDKFNLAWSSGVIVGTFLSGYFFKIKEIYPFIAGSGFSLIGFVLGYINFEKFKSYYKNLPYIHSSEKRLDKELQKICIMNFLNFFSTGSLIFLFPKLAKTIGYSSFLISNILSVHFIVRFLMFYLFSKTKENKALLDFFYFLLAFSLIFTGISRKVFLHILCVSFIGISSAFSYRLTLKSFLQKGYSTELNESIIGIGLFSGSIITGILGQFFGMFNGFILAGFIIILTFIFQKLLLK